METHPINIGKIYPETLNGLILLYVNYTCNPQSEYNDFFGYLCLHTRWSPRDWIYLHA